MGGDMGSQSLAQKLIHIKTNSPKAVKSVA